MGDPEPIDFTQCATVSLTEAALVLGIHRSTAWELWKRGKFPVPVLQIGRRLRVAKLHLARYVTGSSGDLQSVPDEVASGP